MVNVDNVNLPSRGSYRLDPQDSSSTQTRTTVSTRAQFMFLALLDVEGTFVEHRDAGHARASPARIVGLSDIIVHVRTGI